MNTRHRKLSKTAVTTAVAAALGAALLPLGQAAADSGDGAAQLERRDPARAPKHQHHDLDGPFSKQKEAREKAALQQLLSGETETRPRVRKNGSTVVKLDDGKYAELGRATKTDKIFTVLVEFGDDVDNETMYDPDGPDGPEPPVVKYGGDPGPAHNQIAEPDRAVNNSTDWQADYDRQHYQDLYFSRDAGKQSMAKYYEKQSSGKYTVDGEVSDWVSVKWNEARYGSNYCGDSTCSSVWDLVRDATAQWAADQKAAGRTDAEIRQQLAEYDVWDRYDFDGDGDFDESDGYIDHFQLVHAGEDESAGGGVQGEDAIWAHRWYAYGTDAGQTGPGGNKAGGAQIGDTGVWVGDYTVQPENGGLGVFAHEYGHDLGLPDLYDTAGGENSTGFWTLMSSGSWLGRGEDAIGDLPGDMTAWDKLQLGWLDYETAKAATRSKHTLGRAEEQRHGRPQALIVELPEKAVTTTVTTPAEGAMQWWSGMGDDLSNTLTRTVDLTGASTASLGLKGWWDIEENYDYLYAEVSTDGGASFTPLDGTANGAQIPRDGGDRPALTGVSGEYRDLVYPLDAYAGQEVQLRFRYQTDGGVAQKGFTADALSITADGEEVFADGAEGDDAGWTKDGFSRVGESFTNDYPQYYIAENRQYVSYDRTLRSGPYNFGWVTDKPDWVEHFPYQNGLAVWLWDTSQLDNNTSVHPGEGLVLPVDAHPEPERWADGSVMRNRIQTYDATFSTKRTDGFTLHRDGVPAKIRAKRGVSVFDDHKGTYWNEENPGGSVQVPDTHTRISIVKEPGHGRTMTIRVGPSIR